MGYAHMDYYGLFSMDPMLQSFHVLGLNITIAMHYHVCTPFRLSENLGSIAFDGKTP